MYFCLILSFTGSITTWSYNLDYIKELLGNNTETNNKNVAKSKQTLIELFKSGDATFQNNCLTVGTAAKEGSTLTLNGLTIKAKMDGFCGVGVSRGLFSINGFLSAKRLIISLTLAQQDIIDAYNQSKQIN